MKYGSVLCRCARTAVQKICVNTCEVAAQEGSVATPYGYIMSLSFGHVLLRSILNRFILHFTRKTLKYKPNIYFSNKFTLPKKNQNILVYKVPTNLSLNHVLLYFFIFQTESMSRSQIKHSLSIGVGHDTVSNVIIGVS